MKTKTEIRLLTGISILCLFYFSISLIYKPIICNDAINGILSLHNYLNGGEWNKILSLSTDGGHITSYEMTWWAPGQYHVPYLLSKLFFINIGTAIAILMVASVLGGCYFYYKLFNLSALPNKLALWALLILLLQRVINIYFLQYNSSDLLLFFYTPFYIYAYYYLIKTYPQKPVFKTGLLILLNLVGLYLKNSFILLETALNVFLAAEYFFYNKVQHNIIKNERSLFKMLLILLPFIIANLLNYYFFLRLGNNPAQSHGLSFSVANVLTGIFSPVIEVLFASLSLYGIYGNFYDKIVLPQTLIHIAMVIFLLITAYIIYRKKAGILGLFKKDLIFRFTITAAIMYILFWLAFTINQSSISNEDRLYLPVTILLLPYLLHFSLESASKIKYLYFFVISFSVLYGVASFVFRIKKYNINNSVYSKDMKLNGFKVLSKNAGTKPDLDRISRLISLGFTNNYVVVPNQDIAFELNVSNKFIKNTTALVVHPGQSKHGINYVVLVRVGKDSPPVGLAKIYTSEKFSLYKSN